jgi:serine/threonine protein kinase
MGRTRDSWGFAEGDPITSELTAFRRLGGGEAYDAYLAFDDVVYAPVVVKVVRPGQVASESTLRGLRRETEALERITHPAVVRSLRSVVDGERPHVVLEHLDGPRLSSLVRRHGPLPEQQYLPLAVELASALHYLGQVGYVHLDVKPSNIIMGAPARLIDLSVARTVEVAQALSYPVGTDAYMAPEQTAPPETGAPCLASDVWGLGATLFEAIAGYRAFDEGDQDAAELGRRFPQLVDAPYDLPDQVPSDVATLVYAALEPDPDNRPLPRELADGLEPALGRQPPGRLTFKVR